MAEVLSHEGSQMVSSAGMTKHWSLGDHLTQELPMGQGLFCETQNFRAIAQARSELHPKKVDGMLPGRALSLEGHGVH